MSKSLQDQLMSLGLAKKSITTGQGEKSRNTAVGSAQKKAPLQRPGQQSLSDPSLEQAYRLREKQTREQADQVRHRKLMEDRRRRQLNNDIRNVVMPNRLNDPDAEIARNFVFKGRIRKVNVTDEQFTALNEGKLGLVYLAGGYHLLKREHVAQVYTLSPEHVPNLAGKADEVEDDQFPVPDDLIW